VCVPHDPNHTFWVLTEVVFSSGTRKISGLTVSDFQESSPNSFVFINANVYKGMFHNLCGCGLMMAQMFLLLYGRLWFLYFRHHELRFVTRHDLIRNLKKNAHDINKHYFFSDWQLCLLHTPNVIIRLGQLRRLTIFLGASHQLENMKCARVIKNGADWHELKIV
jgi:hypothetical protein